MQASPLLLARAGGALYIVIIVLGTFEEAFVRNPIVVADDAAATAANMQSSEWLWRFGIASELVLLIAAIPLSVIFYILLRPVSRDLALLAVFFDLVSLAVEAAAALGLAAALFPLGPGQYLRAFQPEQLHAMTRLAIRWHAHGFTVALIFFGCFCVVVGYLILKSGYFPKLLGAGMQIVGVCYLTHGFALIMAPPLASWLYPAIFVPPFLGETAVALWLLLKGIDVEKFNAAVTGPALQSTHPAPDSHL
jgi:hypothetical protein